jgi:hypothetical protein
VNYIIGNEEGEALRKLMGMGRDAQGWVKPTTDRKWANAQDGEFAQGSYGLFWIYSIQHDFPDAVYNGKTVAPRTPSRFSCVGSSTMATTASFSATSLPSTSPHPASATSSSDDPHVDAPYFSSNAPRTDPIVHHHYHGDENRQRGAEVKKGRRTSVRCR